MAKPQKNIQGQNAWVSSDWQHAAYRAGIRGQGSLSASVPAAYKADYDLALANAQYQRDIMGTRRTTL